MNFKHINIKYNRFKMYDALQLIVINTYLNYSIDLAKIKNFVRADGE